MLLISFLFLATAVEALPGGGGRQLGKGKKPNKKCKVDVCWKKCQKLKDKEEGSVLPKVLGSKCDIAFMEDCLDCSAAKGKKKKQCKCYKKCKKDDDKCKAACKEEPEPLERRGRGDGHWSSSQSISQSRSFLNCSFLMKGKKRNKCCEKKCKKADDKETCIETCIAA